MLSERWGGESDSCMKIESSSACERQILNIYKREVEEPIKRRQAKSYDMLAIYIYNKYWLDVKYFCGAS